MSDTERIVLCRYCGAEMPWPRGQRKPRNCLPCGIRRATNQQRQMHDHSGPEYERWLTAMQRWAVRHLDL